MAAGRQVSKSLHMLGAQRFGDHILFSEPFAQVDQTAALRAKRAIRTGKPITSLFARWAFDILFHGYGKALLRCVLLQFRRDSLKVRGDGSGALIIPTTYLKRFFHVVTNRLLLRRRQ